ncbi:MAG: AAA family ATPase [Candidatus Eremiobacteraeota bacterium]|nr:AAA family ATPase [Candidatus Eremiobacteraeota bacterium]
MASLKQWFKLQKLPFTKYIWASKMFPSKSQQELIIGLRYSIEIKGISVILGLQGVGKSITLRRFKEDLSPQEYQVFYLWNTRSSPQGFLRSLCRVFQLQPSAFIADMFDALSSHLFSLESNLGKHPIIIFDDCDHLSRDVLEYLRLLMNFQMDSEEHFSIILCGTEVLQAHLKEQPNIAFRQRVTYCQTLRPFTAGDTRAYITYHLQRVDAPPELFTDGAVKLIFQYSRGYPRVINQVALQSLIQAAVFKKEIVDEHLIKRHVLPNLLNDFAEEAPK